MKLQKIRLGDVNPGQMFSWSEDEQPTDVVKYQNGLPRCANEDGAGYTSDADVEVWVEITNATCAMCRNCYPITGVAGADHVCKAKSDDEITFEVSPDDDTTFYSESGNEPCESFICKAAQFVITRHYDDGKATAQLSDEEQPETSDEQYDQYCVSVGVGCDYENVEEWLDEYPLDLDDVAALLLGGVVDISASC